MAWRTSLPLHCLGKLKSDYRASRRACAHGTIIYGRMSKRKVHRDKDGMEHVRRIFLSTVAHGYA